MDPNLVGTEVDIVGTKESQCSRSCTKHICCVTALDVGCYVYFVKERFAWRSKEEEEVLSVFLIEGRGKSCKVGYLPKHLAVSADRYDGLCARVSEIYTSNAERCSSVAKRQKWHRNEGCCITVIVGL